MVLLSGREICPLVMYPSIFLIFSLINNENTSSGKKPTLIKCLSGPERVTVVASLSTTGILSRDITLKLYCTVSFRSEYVQRFRS